MRPCHTVGKAEFDYACSADHKEQLIKYAPEAFITYSSLCVQSNSPTPAGVAALLRAKKLHPTVASKVRSSILLEAEEAAIEAEAAILDSIAVEEKAHQSRKRRHERRLAALHADSSSDDEDAEDAELHRLKALKID
jgi:hypothetical protein